MSNIKKMTLTEALLKEDPNLLPCDDLYNRAFPEWEGTQLTLYAAVKYHDILHLMVEVDEDTRRIKILVSEATDDNDVKEQLHDKLEGFFWDMAGYCEYHEFNKCFINESPYDRYHRTGRKTYSVK